MKINISIFFLVVLLICFSGCSESDSSQLQSYNLIKSIDLMTLPPYRVNDITDAQTRSVAYGTNLAVMYGLEHGDSVGIFPEADYQIPFALPITPGKIVTSSTILAQGWMTKKNILYSVYMPWNFNNRLYNHVPWDYRKIQIQKSNDNKDSLSNYWFFASDTLTSGNSNFGAKLIHMGAILRVQAVVPVTGTFVRMILVSTDKSFATHGYFDLFDVAASKEDINGHAITSNPYNHQPFHALGYSDHITLDFKDVALSSGSKLRGWFIIPETNVSNKLLTIYLWDSNGNCYSDQMVNASANWVRNSVNAIGFANLVLTTTPFTSLNPWENKQDVCPTCTPVAF